MHYRLAQIAGPLGFRFMGYITFQLTIKNCNGNYLCRPKIKNQTLLLKSYYSATTSKDVVKLIDFLGLLPCMLQDKC